MALGINRKVLWEGDVLSIMLVEDSVAVRTRLRAILGEIRRFHVVGEFDTATDAIVAIGAHPPDVVLLDIKLRIGNGIEVLRHISRHAPAVKVIVFSQHDDPEYREQFEQAGAHFFFNKTHEAGELVATLRQLATTK
jgi:DNA-binding NarL/FixJ family response regulator